MKKPLLHVAITGGAGQIAYQLLFRIASGEMFGQDQPLSLQILDVPQVQTSLKGVEMELQDCALPLLHRLVMTADPVQAFQNADYALLVGAKPRGAGMERGDLLQENAKIFVAQGRALNAAAKENVKVFVIGNPCNTNCLIAMNQAPRLSRKNFFSMTRLDQNRASFLLAEKANLSVKDVSHVIVWGNHSSSQVPDFIHARLNGKPVEAYIKDRHWLENDFIESIRKRGAAVIEARGKSSAASAAQAILDAVRDTIVLTKPGDWFSSSVDSTGNPYGIADNLIFSFPCHVVKREQIAIVPGLDIDDFIAIQLKASERELLEERDLVRSLLN